MAYDSVLDPEMGKIKNDEFYLFYEMMMQSLKTVDVKDGITISLSLLRRYLDSGDIYIFYKKEDKTYGFKASDSTVREMLQPVSCIVNKTIPLIEKRKIFNIDMDLSERLENLMLIHIPLLNSVYDDDECIMAIINNNKKDLDFLFWERVKDTMQVILKRAASYERNTKAITTDMLTGLDNRNSYEMRLSQINEEDNNIVFALFDLFRLKFINDSFTHAKGDLYIKETAKILNKYWPKYKVTVNEDTTETYHSTGHCVYRIGGDEFVLMTNKETLQLASIKAELARDEVGLIDLGISDNIIIGLNYGMVKPEQGESMKKTYIKADHKLQEDKDQMYKKYRLERRK